MLGQLPHASAADLDRALAAAQRAWGEWRALLPVQRGKILKKAADLMRARGEEIARIATLEMGKSIHETRIELRPRRKSSTGTRKKAGAPTGACCRSACPASA